MLAKKRDPQLKNIATELKQIFRRSRRAKRAGIPDAVSSAGDQTGIRLPGARARPPGNKKMPAPQNGAQKFKKMSPAPDQMEQFS